MKTVLLSVAIGLTLAALIASILSLWAWWPIYQQMQYLTLADDASTPAKKAEYLGKFIETMRKADLPEHGAFVFKHERNRVENQFEVLESLKARCEELVGKDPESMGYAQGIQQITGQEFDHAIANVGGVFRGALWVRVGWALCWGWLVACVVAGMAWFVVWCAKVFYCW